jgi:uncharacterized protein (TIGR03083 family)
MPEAQANGYRAVRERTTDWLRNVDPGALDAIAPATPKWHVRDVLAHMVGVANDAVEGRLDGIASDPWTAAQVDKRRDASVSDMLDEWNAFGPQFETMLLGAPETIGSQAVFDVFTHEQDMRHALAAPGGRDCESVGVAFFFYCQAREQAGLPMLRIVTETGEFDAGTGDLVATVKTSTFEVVRAATGRRAAEEIAAYEWDGTADPGVLLVAPIFTMRETPLGE